MYTTKCLCVTLFVCVFRVVDVTGQSIEPLARPNQPYLSLNQWSSRINEELATINHLTAYYAWELSTNPTDELSAQSIDFNMLKSKWILLRCSEVDAMRMRLDATVIDKAHERMFHLLCRGPRFSESETVELSRALYQMQTIYTGTQLCVPLHLDLCKNLDHIWDFTYARRPNDNIERLHVSTVRTKKTKLDFFSGNVSDDYYALGASINGDVVIDEVDMVTKRIRSGPFICLDGEPDLDRLMEGDFSPLLRGDCNLRYAELFRWGWEGWRWAVGNQIGEIYPLAMNIMNDGARKNGYEDIGDVWREEVEVPDLQSKMAKLWSDVKPFYALLHAVVRQVLSNRMRGFDGVDIDKTIPAHLLGSMWSQNWMIYHDLLMPFPEVNLDDNINNSKWTNYEMVMRVDDFYSSIGLPKMTKTFWEKSKFEKKDGHQNCHGTAANMYNESDYRMIVCAAETIDDLYVIVHEMGHIQYFMAFAEQPLIFQDANSGLQESIGDALYLGVMAPQHLNRLNILPDKYLMSRDPPLFDQSNLRAIPSANDDSQPAYKHNCSAKETMAQSSLTICNKRNRKISQRVKRNNQTVKDKVDETVNAFDLSLLLRMALMKIPQIPFEYILDVFRWDLFSEKIDMENANDYLWKLIIDEQGLHPPDWVNRRNMFDAGAKFHVADNTPFVRYYLASFMHAQIFRGLCEVTIFGTVKAGLEPLPMPLHRCDIYGSKRAGKLLRKALRLGASKDWDDILFILTGSREISADALLQYYSPLIRWLEKTTTEFNISIGW